MPHILLIVDFAETRELLLMELFLRVQPGLFQADYLLQAGKGFHSHNLALAPRKQMHIMFVEVDPQRLMSGFLLLKAVIALEGPHHLALRKRICILRPVIALLAHF